MLGSFVKHGLTEEEAESETLIQVYVPPKLLESGASIKVI